MEELLELFNLLRFRDTLRRNPSPTASSAAFRKSSAALATQPRLLLLDEPAAGMNPTEKAELVKLIPRIREQFKLTILLVEHSMRVVMGVWR